MADLFRRVGKMLAMRPMTIIPPSQGASAIYNRVTTHASRLLKREREDLGTKGSQFPQQQSAIKMNIRDTVSCMAGGSTGLFY